jgi:hypothetical protein
MWRRRNTNYAYVVLREDGETVIERTGLKVQMLGRVKECLRDGLEEGMRIHPELSESEIFSGLACLADHSLDEAEGYAGLEVAVRSEAPFPPDYDNLDEVYRRVEGLEMREVYQDDFDAAA